MTQPVFLPPTMQRTRRAMLVAAGALLAAGRLSNAVAQAASRPSGSASASNATSGRRLRVVASFSILADMTSALAGEGADVASLVGPDADAHVYAPSPADVRRLASADLVVVNGLRFEGWLERLIGASGYRGPVVVATKSVTPRAIGGGPDPHAWQSLRLARAYVENIALALKAAAPDRAAYFEERTRNYLTAIEQLDSTARARFGAIPQDERRVITSHDAFGYLGAAYGIEFIAPQGRNTDSEASAADVARVIRQLKEQRVRALFVENITDPRLIERIAKEAGVISGGRLYSDALSAPGTAADTYLKMYAHNVNTLADAMQAPPKAPR